MRKLMVVAGLLALSAPAWGDEESPGFGRKGLELTGGLGGGEYVYRSSPLDPAVTVPFREIGLGARWGVKPRVVLGVQLSLRDDQPISAEESVVGSVSFGPMPGSSSGTGASDGTMPPGEDDVISAGTRWRVAPYAEYRYRAVRLRGGLVAGDYYNPMDSEEDTLWIYPQFMLGLGSDEYAIELGFMDAPPLASSANGGLGVVALRTAIRITHGHRATFGVGAPYGGPGAPDGALGGSPDTGGFFSYAYQADLSQSLKIDLGGYTSTVTTGLFVAVGKSFE